jgi:hypothetical protein
MAKRKKILAYGKCPNCGFEFKSWSKKCPKCGKPTTLMSNGKKALKYRLAEATAGSFGVVFFLGICLVLIYLLIKFIPGSYLMPVAVGMSLLVCLMRFIRPKATVLKPFTPKIDK